MGTNDDIFSELTKCSYVVAVAAQGSRVDELWLSAAEQKRRCDEGQQKTRAVVNGSRTEELW